MDRCPELVELESLFQTTGISEFDGEADDWHYGIQRFEYLSGEDRFVCRFSPSDDAIAFAHSSAGKARWDISLVGLASLDVEMSAGRALLIGRLKNGPLEQLFKLALKPSVTFSLSSTGDTPSLSNSAL